MIMGNEQNNKGKSKKSINITDNSSSKKKKKELVKKNNGNSDDDNIDDDIPISDADEDEDDDFNVHEYRKFLNKIFPSRHLQKKIEEGEKVKKAKSPTNKKYKDKSSETDSDNVGNEQIITRSKKK